MSFLVFAFLNDFCTGKTFFAAVCNRELVTYTILSDDFDKTHFCILSGYSYTFILSKNLTKIITQTCLPFQLFIDIQTNITSIILYFQVININPADNFCLSLATSYISILKLVLYLFDYTFKNDKPYYYVTLYY